MGSGWPGAGGAEPYRQVGGINEVHYQYLVQSRRGSKRHIFRLDEQHTLCNVWAVSMRKINGSALVSNWYQIHTVVSRFDALLKLVTCSTCVAEWSASRILASDLA